jgi:hypothetical protein
MDNQRDRAGDEHGYDAKADPAVGLPSPGPATPPADAGEAWSFRTAEEQRRHDQDPEYTAWREAQMQSFDREYEEYRRQHPAGRAAGFAEWRLNRERQGR